MPSLILASHPAQVPAWLSDTPALCTTVCSCLKSAESPDKSHVSDLQRKWSTPLTLAGLLCTAAVPILMVRQSSWDCISYCNFSYQHLLAIMFLLYLSTHCSTLSGAHAGDTREANIIVLDFYHVHDNRTIWSLCENIL